MNSQTQNSDVNKANQQQFKSRKIWITIFTNIFFPGLGYFYCGEIKRGFIVFSVVFSIDLIFGVLLNIFPTVYLLYFFVFYFMIYNVLIIFDSIQIAKEKKQYILQPFNRSKYYAVILVVMILYSGKLNDLVYPESYTTPTRSMYNTILIGDVISGNKYQYGIKNPFTGRYILMYNYPQLGDVISFRYRGSTEAPPTEKTFHMKRIIGLPGDSIVIKSREIYLNNEKFKKYWVFNFGGVNKISSDYHDLSIFPRGFEWNTDNYGPVRVPKAGEMVSFDTSTINMWKRIIRDEGNKLEIIRERIFINDIEKYSYTFKNNYYFLVGDNWYNSFDSRYFGFVNENDIDSKLTFIYFSWVEDSDDPNNAIRWDRIGKMIE